MKRRLTFAAVAGVGVLAILGASGAAASVSSDSRPSHATIRVIEHAITDTEVPVGTQGLTQPGNLLVFQNPVFNGTNARQVGSDQGDCIRIVVTNTQRTWECRWITFLSGGGITVEGPFSELPNQRTVLPVTGGTGDFRNARGQMILQARNPDETEFDFIFELIGVSAADR